MNTDEKYIARIIFKNKVYQSDSNSFEDLFCTINELESPTFKRVKPQGSYGDRKNDGFDSSSNTYYQVYAPEDLPSKEDTAVKKLNEDFEGLKKYWQGNGFKIENFFYVINDKYKGVYPTLYAAIKTLNDQNKNINIDVFRAFNLEDIFLQLNELDTISVTGPIPNPYKINDIDYEILSEVVNFVLEYEVSGADETIPANPDFEDKITFNSISESFANFLRVGRQQTYVVNDFFKYNSNFAKDELRDKFQSLYSEGKDLYGESATSSDQIFLHIRNKSTPSSKKVYYDAVYVLMAHYFEYCDIFEPVK